MVKAAAPKPVNVLMPGALGLTVADLAALGVRRISVGGTLARVAWGAFIRAAKTIASDGRFDAFKDAVPHRRDQWLLPRRHEGAMTAAMTSRSQAHPVTGQPVGLPVDTTPARRPGPVTLDGRYGRVERLDRSARGSAVEVGRGP